MVSIQAQNYGYKRKEEHLVDAFKTIDRIFKTLNEMEDLGYAMKTNKFMITFCTMVRYWMSDVFLTPSSYKKDAFTIKTKYYVLESSETVKDNLSEMLIKEGTKDLGALCHDI